MFTINNKVDDITKFDIKRKLIAEFKTKELGVLSVTKDNYRDSNLYKNTIHKIAIDKFFDEFEPIEEIKNIRLEVKHFDFSKHHLIENKELELTHDLSIFDNSLIDWDAYSSDNPSSNIMTYSDNVTGIRFDYYQWLLSNRNLNRIELYRFNNILTDKGYHELKKPWPLFKDAEDETIKYSLVNYKEENNNYARYQAFNLIINSDFISERNLMDNYLTILETIRFNNRGNDVIVPVRLYRLVNDNTGEPIRFSDLLKSDSVYVEDNDDYSIEIKQETAEFNVFLKQVMHFEDIETEEYKISVIHDKLMHENGFNKITTSGFNEYQKENYDIRINWSNTNTIRHTGKTYNYFVTGTESNLILDDLINNITEDNAFIIKMLFPDIRNKIKTDNSFAHYANIIFDNPITNNPLEYFKTPADRVPHYSNLYYKTVSDSNNLIYDNIIKRGDDTAVEYTDKFVLNVIPSKREPFTGVFRTYTNKISESDMLRHIGRREFTEEDKVRGGTYFYYYDETIPNEILKGPNKTSDFICYAHPYFKSGYRIEKKTSDFSVIGSIKSDYELLYESNKNQIIDAMFFNINDRVFYVKWKNPLELKENQKINLKVSINETLF